MKMITEIIQAGIFAFAGVLLIIAIEFMRLWFKNKNKQNG